MRYKAAIEVFGEEDLVYRCFEPEIKSMKKGRASYEIKKKKGSTEFMLDAEDSVALRATLNSITKMLEVLEKTK